MNLKIIHAKTVRTVLPMAAALLLLLAVSPGAHAQLTLNLSSPAQNAAPGDTLSFAGTLSNLTAGAVFLNGASFTFSGPAEGLTLDTSPFLSAAPASLPPMGDGDTYRGDFFSVFLSASALPGTYQGTFSVLGGADGDVQAVVASEPFFVTVSPSSAPVPEASSGISLGTLSLLGVLAVQVRRRRTESRPCADATTNVPSITNLPGVA